MSAAPPVSRGRAAIRVRHDLVRVFEPVVYQVALRPVAASVLQLMARTMQNTKPYLCRGRAPRIMQDPGFYFRSWGAGLVPSCQQHQEYLPGQEAGKAPEANKTDFAWEPSGGDQPSHIQVKLELNQTVCAATGLCSLESRATAKPPCSSASCRTQVLAYLPNLRTLDFISCTKVDRDKARVWCESKMRRHPS